MGKDDLTENRPDPEDEINFRHNGQYRRIRASDILFCESDGNYTSVFLERPEKLSVICKRLCFFKRKLKKYKHFYQCHKSYIVNLDQIIGYSIQNNKKRVIISDYTVPVSRKNWKEILPLLVKKGVTETEK